MIADRERVQAMGQAQSQAESLKWIASSIFMYVVAGNESAARERMDYMRSMLEKLDTAMNVPACKAGMAERFARRVGKEVSG